MSNVFCHNVCPFVYKMHDGMHKRTMCSASHFDVVTELLLSNSSRDAYVSVLYMFSIDVRLVIDTKLHRTITYVGAVERPRCRRSRMMSSHVRHCTSASTLRHVCDEVGRLWCRPLRTAARTGSSSRSCGHRVRRSCFVGAIVE